MRGLPGSVVTSAGEPPHVADNVARAAARAACARANSPCPDASAARARAVSAGEAAPAFTRKIHGLQGCTRELKRFFREGDALLGGEGLDVGNGGSCDHFGTAHRIFLGGDFALFGCESDAPAALASALECLVGLHGGFETPHSLHASSAEEVFDGNIQRGIGPKAGLFDQGLGGTFSVSLRDESGISFHRTSECGR